MSEIQKQVTPEEEEKILDAIHNDEVEDLDLSVSEDPVEIPDEDVVEETVEESVEEVVEEVAEEPAEPERDLAAELTALQSKYDELLAKHEALLARFDSFIENGGVISNESELIDDEEDDDEPKEIEDLDLTVNK